MGASGVVWRIPGSPSSASATLLQATQDGYAQQAYIASLGKSAPYTANAQAAQALGLDAGEAQLILDDLNAEPDPDADKEDWQKELEAKVVEETGADSA